MQTRSSSSLSRLKAYHSHRRLEPVAAANAARPVLRRRARRPDPPQLPPASQVTRRFIFRKASALLWLFAATFCMPAWPATADATGNHYDPLDFVPTKVPSARLMGEATLRKYGKPIYEAKLFVDPAQFSAQDLPRETFALDLEYAKPCAGHGIAKDIAKQMSDMGMARSADIRVWQRQLLAFIPDVRGDDHLTAVYDPQRGTRFFRNGTHLGEIAGEAFASAFFGIWLDDTTTMPGVRQQLLGGAH